MLVNALRYSSYYYVQYSFYVVIDINFLVSANTIHYKLFSIPDVLCLQWRDGQGFQFAVYYRRNDVL